MIAQSEGYEIIFSFIGKLLGAFINRGKKFLGSEINSYVAAKQ